MAIRKVSTAAPVRGKKAKRGPISSLWWALALMVLIPLAGWLISTDWYKLGFGLLFFGGPVMGLTFLITNHREHTRR